MQPRHAVTGRRGGPCIIRQPRQVAALATPVRQSIVDAIAASGACTVAELAAQLGRPASGLYHHVRALERVGLLVCEGEGESPARGAGRPAARYDVPGRPVRIEYAPGSAATRRPMQRMVGAMTRLASREFGEGYREGVRVSGRRRELWASRTEAWLTEEQLERANVLLGELFALFGEGAGAPRSGARLRALTFVLAPGRPE